MGGRGRWEDIVSLGLEARWAAVKREERAVEKVLRTYGYLFARSPRPPASALPCDFLSAVCGGHLALALRAGEWLHLGWQLQLEI